VSDETPSSTAVLLAENLTASLVAAAFTAAHHRERRKRKGLEE
jgi:hypothetical protein